VKLVAWGKQKENREGIRDKVLDAIRKLEYHKKEVTEFRGGGFRREVTGCLKAW